MKLPFINYIKVLIVCGKTVEEILDILLATGLPLTDKVTPHMIRTIAAYLNKSNPKWFNTQTGAPDLVWLKDEGIDKFVAKELQLSIDGGTDGIDGAVAILSDKTMYTVLTALALVKASDEDIELIINIKYNIHFSIYDIKEFLNYFFNMQDWSIVDKKQYVATITDKQLLPAYKIALEGDKDYLAWKLGIAPEISFESMLKQMMTDSFYKYKENIKSDIDTAQKWGAMAIKLSDKLERLNETNSAKKSIFAEFVFSVETTETVDPLKPTSKIKHISELNSD